MSSHPRRQLSNEEAEAIALRNQQESPLFRLPAEIRNQIYNYVLGGMVIESKPESEFTTQTRILVWGPPVRLRPSNPVESDVNLSVPLQLLEVCRQIHMETRLLPFLLSTFYIQLDELDDFLDGLNDAQQDAITTFLVNVRMKLKLCSPAARVWLRTSPSSFKSTPTNWCGLQALSRMKSLKRVVVEDWTPRNDQAQDGRDKKSAASRIAWCARKSDIEVSFKHLVPLSNAAGVQSR